MPDRPKLTIVAEVSQILCLILAVVGILLVVWPPGSDVWGHKVPQFINVEILKFLIAGLITLGVLIGLIRLRGLDPIW